MRTLLVVLFLSVVAYAQPKIVVENPWVREVPPVSTMSAMFMTLTNKGNEEDYLVGVESSISEVAEIHTTFMEEGMMKMKQLKEIKVPAGGKVEFKPMGKHIMLINLKSHPKAGEFVEVVLHFKKSGRIKVKAPVRGMGGMHH